MYTEEFIYGHENPLFAAYFRAVGHWYVDTMGLEQDSVTEMDRRGCCSFLVVVDSLGRFIGGAKLISEQRCSEEGVVFPFSTYVPYSGKDRFELSRCVIDPEFIRNPPREAIRLIFEWAMNVSGGSAVAVIRDKMFAFCKLSLIDRWVYEEVGNGLTISRTSPRGIFNFTPILMKRRAVYEEAVSRAA